MLLTATELASNGPFEHRSEVARFTNYFGVRVVERRSLSRIAVRNRIGRTVNWSRKV